MPREPGGDVAGPSLDEPRSGPDDCGCCAGNEPKRAWSLWNAGRAAHAEASRHPRGCQLKVYMDGRFIFSTVRPTCGLTARDADEFKRAGMERGWTDRPPTPDE